MKTLKAIGRKTVAAALVAICVTSCSREAERVGILQKADNYFKAGEYDSARIEYLNLLKIDPQNAAAIQQLGTMWFEDGAPFRALPFLLKARELAPRNLNCRTKLAMALMALGEMSKARDETIAILDQDPTNDDAIILLAQTARTPQEVAETEQRLQIIRGRDKAPFYLALASLSTRKGDLAGAEEAVQHAITLDGKLPSAHLAMAGLMLLRANPAEAAREFKTAAELAAVRTTARLKYAEFKANSGAAAEAATMLKEMTRQAPDFLPAWGLLAKIAYKQKNCDESLALLENVFNRDPLNPEGHLLQSDIYLAKGEAKLALEGLDRLNQVYPHVPAVKCHLACAYLQNDNPGKATITLNQALALNPDDIDAALLLGEANLGTGDAQAVIASMQSLLKKRPDLAQARLLLAAAYRSAGQLDDSAATFRQQINLLPQSAQAYVGLGLTLREQGRMNEARGAFEKAQDLEPENPAPLQQLVELDILNKDFVSAFQRVRNPYNATSGSADANCLEGKIYFSQGEWDHAEVALLKALKLDPYNTNADDLLICTYIAANKLTDALGRLNSLLSKRPDDVRLLMLAGLVYEKGNQFSNARDTYEKLLSVHPDFTPALNKLACLYAERLNELDKAYDLARRARALEPEAAATADTLGWIVYKRADYDQALRLLKESAEKLPNNPAVQFHLGMAYYMTGQMDAARAALRQAAGAQLEFPGKRDAQSRLALLGAGSGGPPTQSIGELETILKQRPDDIVARLLLCDSYEKQGEFADAAAACEEAIKVNRTLGPAFVRLANLYAGPLNNREKAIEFSRKAKELSPN